MGQAPNNATEHNGLRLGCSFLFWLAVAAGVSLMTPSAYEPAAGIIGYLGFTGLGKQPGTLFFALSMLAVPLLSIATSHLANRILGSPRRTASGARLQIATRIDRVVDYLSRKPFIVVLLGSATIYVCFWTANIHVPLDFFHEENRSDPLVT